MNSDFPGSGSPQGGARCVTHPDNLAGGTCSRCGNFLCYVDTEGGRFSTCETCRARTGLSGAFPLNRENYNFGALWDYCWNLFKEHWLMLSVGVLIPLIAYFVIYFALYSVMLGAMFAGGNIFRGGAEDGAGAIATGIASMAMMFGMALILSIVVGMLTVGFCRMCLDVLEGGQPDIGRMFSVFNKAGRGALVFATLTIGSYLVAAVTLGPAALSFALLESSNETLAIVLAAVLGVVGFVAYMFLLLPIYLLPQEMAFADVGVFQWISNVWKTASGFRWSIVLLTLVCIPIYFLGILACCIGVLPALALMGLLFNGLQRALRTGAPGVVPQT